MMSASAGSTSRIGLLVQLGLMGFLLGSGCREPAQEPVHQEKLTVVTTTGMVTDLVQAIVGEHAEVVGLLGAVDPHLYKPTPHDVIQIRDADVVFYSGLHLEGQMAKVFEQSNSSSARMLAVTSGLTSDQLLTPEGSAGHPDPHVWHDPLLWGECALFVAEQMAQIDPDHAAEFRANAIAYQAKLTQFDRFAKDVLGAVPESKRQLVTAHDAFEYFARRYSLQVQSIQGISTESEAGLYDVNRIVDLLVTNKIPCIFVESTVNQSYVQQVIAGAKERGWDVTMGEILYSDALGDPGTYQGTYLGMLDHNVAAIANGLQSAHEGPFSFRECQTGNPPDSGSP